MKEIENQRYEIFLEKMFSEDTLITSEFLGKEINNKRKKIINKNEPSS